jgi:hypothetical protein
MAGDALWRPEDESLIRDSEFEDFVSALGAG